MVLLNSAYQTVLTTEANYQTEARNTICALGNLLTKFSDNANTLENVTRDWGTMWI